MPYVFHWGADVDYYCSECKRLVVHKGHNGMAEVKGPAQPQDSKEPYVAMPEMEKNLKLAEDPNVPIKN
jgi:hypothetical protein